MNNFILLLDQYLLARDNYNYVVAARKNCIAKLYDEEEAKHKCLMAGERLNDFVMKVI